MYFYCMFIVLSLDMVMRLNDLIIYYSVVFSVPASAAPDNWCLEVGCTTVERKYENKITALGAAGYLQ